MNIRTIWFEGDCWDATFNRVYNMRLPRDVCGDWVFYYQRHMRSIKVLSCQLNTSCRFYDRGLP